MNMYEWITRKRNFVGGQCPYQCSYCSTNSFKKRFPNANKKYSGELRLIEKELEKNEGCGRVIFIQNCSDLFAKGVKSEWIERILEHCRKFDNTYLFQTKNPQRYLEIGLDNFPHNSLFGTTLESNRFYEKISKAPTPIERAEWMELLGEKRKKIITIEPILQFDLIPFVVMIKAIKPKWVNIGADSKGHNLPEPSSQDIKNLIEELEEFTEVKIKDNLKRLTK